jgi:hypothetical protein
MPTAASECSGPAAGVRAVSVMIPVSAVRAVVGFDVLPGDQRQQSDRVGRFRVEFALGKVPEDAVRVADEGIDQVARASASSQAMRGFPGWA